MVEKFEAMVQQFVDQGYGVVDGFLDDRLCELLRNNLNDKYHEGELMLAGIGNDTKFQKNVGIRNDFISWIESETLEVAEISFFSLVSDFSHHLNSTCFTGIGSSEFHYALYKIGSFYKRHLDQFNNNNNRLYSLISYVNEDWQEDDGGELVLYLPTGDLKILPKGGRTVFFRSSEIEHEVLPSRRERMSITGWLRK